MLHEMAYVERPVSEESLSPLVSILARRFIQRWDCYARQLDDGRFICVQKMLSPSLLMDHLQGKVTLGAYLLNRQSASRYIVLDADCESSFKRLTKIVKVLASEGALGYLERSRRGGHVWFFFAHAISGRDTRAFGNGIMAVHQLEDIELYPKQDQLVDGPGSLIRLPFGVHRRTGRRYPFITTDGKPLAPTIRDQLKLFGSIRPVSEMAFEAYQSVSPPPGEPKMMRISSSNAETVSGRIKEAVSVLEFVSQYVDLDERGMGHCPFHDDEHPSFGVNDKGNYWHCFAGCGGGSVIDFWAKWREKNGVDSSFTSTITELVKMLF